MMGALDCRKRKEGKNVWGQGIHPLWGCSSLRWRATCYQNKVPRPLIAGPMLVSSGFAHSLGSGGIAQWLSAQALVSEYPSMNLSFTMY